ncbi:MAG: hypothetical protein ACTSP1_13715 [Candidatus Freyarchaeota archaeon]
MFEWFLSNVTSILTSGFFIVVAIIVVYIFCLCVIWYRNDFLFYYIMRDQVRLVKWLISSTATFFRNHWRFALVVFLFGGLYLAFYSALPGWTETHTLQKHMVSAYSSAVITATMVLLAKRKMSWALKLAPVTVVSTTGILMFYLHAESMTLTPQLTQPLPLELVAVVLAPSIIGASLLRRLYLRIKTKRTDVYLPQNTLSPTNSYDPCNGGSGHGATHPSGGRRSPSKIEKAYGTSAKKTHPNTHRLTGETEPRTGGTREESFEHLLEREKERVEKLFKTLFPED